MLSEKSESERILKIPYMPLNAVSDVSPVVWQYGGVRVCAHAHACTYPCVYVPHFLLCLSVINQFK